MKSEYYYLAKRACTQLLVEEAKSPNMKIIYQIAENILEDDLGSCPARQCGVPHEQIPNYGIKAWNYSNMQWMLLKSTRDERQKVLLWLARMYNEMLA